MKRKKSKCAGCARLRLEVAGKHEQAVRARENMADAIAHRRTAEGRLSLAKSAMMLLREALGA